MKKLGTRPNIHTHLCTNFNSCNNFTSIKEFQNFLNSFFGAHIYPYDICLTVAAKGKRKEEKP